MKPTQILETMQSLILEGQLQTANDFLKNIQEADEFTWSTWTNQDIEQLETLQEKIIVLHLCHQAALHHEQDCINLLEEHNTSRLPTPLTC